MDQENERSEVVEQNKMVVQIPVGLLRELLNGNEVNEVLDALSKPWAVIASHVGGGESHRRAVGFLTREALGDWLEFNYREMDISAVLRSGKPVKFNMRVRARIG